jgi:hypothetical protein
MSLADEIQGARIVIEGGRRRCGEKCEAHGNLKMVLVM